MKKKSKLSQLKNLFKGKVIEQPKKVVTTKKSPSTKALKTTDKKIPAKKTTAKTDTKKPLKVPKPTGGDFAIESNKTLKKQVEPKLPKNLLKDDKNEEIKYENNKKEKELALKEKRKLDREEKKKEKLEKEKKLEDLKKEAEHENKILEITQTINTEKIDNTIEKESKESSEENLKTITKEDTKDFELNDSLKEKVNHDLEEDKNYTRDLTLEVDELDNIEHFDEFLDKEFNKEYTYEPLFDKNKSLEEHEKEKNERVDALKHEFDDMISELGLTGLKTEPEKLAVVESQQTKKSDNLETESVSVLKEELKNQRITNEMMLKKSSEDKKMELELLKAKVEMAKAEAQKAEAEAKKAEAEVEKERIKTQAINLK